MKHNGERLFNEIVGAIAGSDLPCEPGTTRRSPPLGGIQLPLQGNRPFAVELAGLVAPLTELEGEELESFRAVLEEQISSARREAVQILSESPDRLVENWERELEHLSPDAGEEVQERVAHALVQLLLPELALKDEEILDRWRLSGVEENPAPIRPEEVVLQLNALYTEPEGAPPSIWKEAIRSSYDKATPEERGVCAEYDHPVPLFAPAEEHELIGCLKELDEDIAYEKECGVLPKDHVVTVVVSVSVTHPYLDDVAGRWLRELLGGAGYRHLRILFLTEGALRWCQSELFMKEYPVFSVLGSYARHFNALKYFQLLLERGFGLRAGFKLDTDEGIRSRELKEITGRSWFQTLCHPLWGGRATDWKGRTFELGVNEGEYVDSRDIDRLGYAGALREPDVKIPATLLGEELFFQKSLAHGRATTLYNRAGDNAPLSHPVVKGGGYGITNAALRLATPFAHSRTGRAEDQQFYFSAIANGVKGIFAPNLRIAHYKSSVAKAEEKTEAGRLIGDLLRLLLFHYLIPAFGVKEDVDPMPGVFATRLARPLALFHLVYRSWCMHNRGKERVASELLQRGIPQLMEMVRLIDSGTVGRELKLEQAEWRELVQEIDGVRPERAREVLGSLFVQG